MPHDPDSPDQTRLLHAILPHVPFDGWSDAAFAAACADLGLTLTEGRAMVPGGAVDLAVAHHRAGDAAMIDRLPEVADLRYSAKVAALIRVRLEGADREVIRRGTVLFALPSQMSLGAQLVWGTADAIWTALGDTSEDINWYSKRAILSAVYGSVVLFWLGDTSGGSDTDAFIDRRIADVMRFERVKAGVRANPVLAPLASGLDRLVAEIRAPGSRPVRDDLPGIWVDPAHD